MLCFVVQMSVFLQIKMLLAVHLVVHQIQSQFWPFSKHNYLHKQGIDLLLLKCVVTQISQTINAIILSSCAVQPVTGKFAEEKSKQLIKFSSA